MRQISALIVGVATMLIVGCPAAQTKYPEKPVRMVVGSHPAVWRTPSHACSAKNSEAWAKPMVIDNVSGAAGNIATERVAKAASDGYTLGQLGQTQLVINPSLYKADV